MTTDGTQNQQGQQQPSADPIFEKLQAAFRGEEYKGPEAPAPGAGDAAGQQQTPQDPTPGQSTAKPQGGFDPFSVLSRRVSNEQYKFEPPTEAVSGVKPDGSPLTEDERFDILVDSIAKHMDPLAPFRDDPFIMRYVEERAKGNFDLNNFIGGFNQLNNIEQMDNAEFLIMDFKQRNGVSEANPNGYTDEQISEYITGMNPIQRDEMARQRKSEFIQNMQLTEQLTPEQQSARTAERVAEDRQLIDALVNSMSSVDEIAGLKHGEAERKEFGEFFNYMVSTNPDIGDKPLNALLTDDRQLYYLLWGYWNMTKNNITDMMSAMKESVKENVFEKLDLGPKISGTRTAPGLRIPTASDFVRQ